MKILKNDLNKIIRNFMDFIKKENISSLESIKEKLYGETFLDESKEEFIQILYS